MTDSNTEDFKNVVDLDSRRVGDYRPGPPGLKGGGGGGTFDGMEARVAVLENEVKHIREDIGLIRTAATKTGTDTGEIKVDVAVLKERIVHLPTKAWAVGIALSTVTVVGALIALAPKLQKLVGSI